MQELASWWCRSRLWGYELSVGGVVGVVTRLYDIVGEDLERSAQQGEVRHLGGFLKQDSRLERGTGVLADSEDSVAAD